MRLIYSYFEPAALQSFTETTSAEMALRPGLLFEDKTIWDSALKLKCLAESPAADDRCNFAALAAVLIHEYLRFDRAASVRESCPSAAASPLCSRGSD
jgi:AraC family transcriptional regulator